MWHFRTIGRAAALAFAAVLGFAAIVTGFASALAFTVVLALAGMFGLVGGLKTNEPDTCLGVLGSGGLGVGLRRRGLRLNAGGGAAQQAGDGRREDGPLTD